MSDAKVLALRERVATLEGERAQKGWSRDLMTLNAELRKQRDTAETATVEAIAAWIALSRPDLAAMIRREDWKNK